MYDQMDDMQTVLTRCLYCLGRVEKTTGRGETAYVKCLVCKKQMAAAAIDEKVQELQALYRSGMVAMDAVQIDKAVQLFSLFISVVERAACGRPIKELHLAQEALRLCLGTSGTKYAASNHLTLSIKPKNQLVDK